MSKITVVVNTFNEEKNLPRALSSIKDWAEEVVVCDMHSTDKTVEIAKKFRAKIFTYPQTGYVEPARNFVLRQASGKHILVLDADEEIPPTLAEKLKKITEEEKFDYVLIPRKNIIFGKWIQNSRWWPDYVIRFFKKGKVTWSDKIHSVPEARGKELKLALNEENALIHYNYTSISQYLERLNRYTTIQAQQLVAEGYSFNLADLVKRPTDEFLSRFFAGEGYKDGFHGLVLASLQALSEFIVYLKVWEKEGFKEQDIQDFFKLSEKALKDYFYWQIKKTSGIFGKLRLKIKSWI